MYRFTFPRVSRLLGGLVLAGACGLTSHAQAAQIFCETAGAASVDINKLNSRYPLGAPQLVTNSCFKIHVEGEIVNGDYRAFRSILKEAEPHAKDVILLSPSGDVGEAIKIGNLIRDRMLQTHTAIRMSNNTYRLEEFGKVYCEGPQCICASACFLIWSAGIYRHGDVLMVHRPRDASGSFGSKDAARARNEYGALMQHISGYLENMEVPLTLIQLMTRTPSNSSLLLPTAQIKDNLKGYTPTITEWLLADCGGLTPAEDNLLGDMMDSGSARYDERFLPLAEKWRASYDCRSKKIIKERVRLAKDSPL